MRKCQCGDLTFLTHMYKGHNTHSCTARAIDSAVEPVSLTLSKVTFGRSSSSLSLLICLGDRPLGSVCAARTGHRHESQTHDTGAGPGNLQGISHSVCREGFLIVMRLLPSYIVIT